MPNKALASALIAVLVVLPAAGAQAQAAGSKPAGMTVEQGKAASPETESKTKPMKTASAGGKRPVHINDDARFCLDRPTTAEIIKCAEPYRY
jgi:hypothetical protein